MKAKSKSSNLLIGSMLFGLFFGAGNLIFPVHMGQEAGQNVLMAAFGFLLTATGIPFLGVIAMGLTGSKNTIELGSRVGKVYAYVLTIVLYLTIGPLFALPRTATVSFEVGFTPILPDQHKSLGLLLFTLLFFTTALFFSLRPNQILDWIGKILNPLFLVFLAFLLIKALISPMGTTATAQVLNNYRSTPFLTGFLEGYQTMDALAALAFAPIVIDSVKSFGITKPNEIAKNTIQSGLVTLILMCIIYGGLSWLGATSTSILAVTPNGGLALAEISRHYLGVFGSIFLAITITIACLKTAIGLITSCSRVFNEIFPHSLSYSKYAVGFSAFSCLVSNIGLDQIISLALPMLMFIYPLAITLIFLALFERFFNQSKIVYLCVTIGALVVSVGDCLYHMPDFISKSNIATFILSVYKNYIPFFEDGMGWLIPSLIGLLIGLILNRTKTKKQV